MIDSYSSENFNMPFFRQLYDDMSFFISRAILSLFRPSRLKVIAVDADNTLWHGECAVQSTVKLNEDNLLFQRFLIDKLREGYLLVLLSKNNQSDVENTFEIMQNSMILRREHFAIVKVNWHPKHLNLYEAAKELNLSLDSFIFFDDSPVECLNMRMNLGEDILVIQIPTNDATRLKFLLDSLWIFDAHTQSSIVVNRTDMHIQEIERKKALEAATSIVRIIISIIEEWSFFGGRVFKLTLQLLDLSILLQPINRNRFFRLLFLWNIKEICRKVCFS